MARTFRVVTEAQILELLARKDEVGMHAVGRALVVLYNRQTETEQTSEQTYENNGRGFNGQHGDIGASMAQFYKDKGFLTQKQLSFWQKPSRRKPLKDGTPGKSKIGIYSRQLVEEANRNMALEHFVCVPFSEVSQREFKELRKWFKDNVEKGEYHVEVGQQWRVENGSVKRGEMPTEGVYFLDTVSAVAYRMAFGG